MMWPCLVSCLMGGGGGGVKAACSLHPGTFILSSQCQSCFVTIIIGLINSDGRLQLNEIFKYAADDVTNVTNPTVESTLNGSDISVRYLSSCFRV